MYFVLIKLIIALSQIYTLHLQKILKGLFNLESNISYWGSCWKLLTKKWTVQTVVWLHGCADWLWSQIVTKAESNQIKTPRWSHHITMLYTFDNLVVWQSGVSTWKLCLVFCFILSDSCCIVFIYCMYKLPVQPTSLKMVLFLGIVQDTERVPFLEIPLVL